MLLDLIAAVVFTAAAAIVIAALASRIAGGAAARWRGAAALGGWFAAVAALGATDALGADGGLGAPGVGAVVLLPILALGYAATRPGVVRELWLDLPLPLLVGLNAWRVLGAGFVLLYAAGRLPAPFAPTAGWGDVLVGVMALPLAVLVARRAGGWRAATLAWNGLGLLDLVAAVALGVASSPGTPLRIFFDEPGTGIMSSLPWLLIPGFFVPLFIVMHLAVFARLLAGAHRSPRASALA